MSDAATSGSLKESAFLDACDLSDTGISESAARDSEVALIILAVMVWSAIEETDGDNAVRIAHRILEGPL